MTGRQRNGPRRKTCIRSPFRGGLFGGSLCKVTRRRGGAVSPRPCVSQSYWPVQNAGHSWDRQVGQHGRGGKDEAIQAFFAMKVEKKTITLKNKKWNEIIHFDGETQDYLKPSTYLFCSESEIMSLTSNKSKWIHLPLDGETQTLYCNFCLLWRV